MRILLALLWIGVACLDVAGWAKSDDSKDWSDSGVSGPRYALILESLDALARRYPDLSTVLEYGKSVQGRPLRLLLVMKKNRRFADHPTLLMSGTTHGNEYLNIEDRLPAQILSKSASPGNVSRFLEEGGAFLFIPILNPDGYEAHVRENSHGIDLNRDWDVKAAHFKGFNEVETRALSAELEKLRQAPYRLHYSITVDYHCCIGALLQPWGFSKKKMPERDAAKHAAVEQMAKRLLDIDGGTTNEVLGYMPLGTTKDFYYDRFGAISFTYEGRFQVEKNYFDKHVRWWEEMAGYLLRSPAAGSVAVGETGKKSGFGKLAD